MTWTNSAFDALVAEVAAHAAATCPQPLPPAATAGELAEAERRLGFSLHPLLRRLYGEIADGGFGPEYFLLPLSGGGENNGENDGEIDGESDGESDEEGSGESVVGEYGAFTAVSDGNGPRRRIWPVGVVPILTYGSGMYAGVDCTDPAGAVLLYEPNGGSQDPAEAWFLDCDDLATWLRAWIDDTAWYREDADLDEHPPELYLWSAAAERLASDSW